MPRYIRIFLLIGFLVVAISCFQKPVLATPTYNNQRFEFTVDFVEPDWNHMTINATVSSKISSFPSPFLTIPCTVKNLHYFEDEPWHAGSISYDMVQSETQTINQTNFATFVNQSKTKFWLIGLAEFYPYDSYLLNLTFMFADNGLANDNNTSVEMNFPWWHFYGWKIETAPTRITHVGDFVEITSTATIARSSWSIEPFRNILWIMFLVIGISYLISPKNLQARLSIYISILLFSITFFFQTATTAPPRIASLSLLEKLTLHLLLATSAFLLLSVLERVAIFEYKTYPKVRGALVFETFGVLIVAFVILIEFNSYVIVAERYFSWVDIPHLDYLLVFSLSFGLLLKCFHYVSRYIKERRSKSRIQTLNDFT